MKIQMMIRQHIQIIMMIQNKPRKNNSKYDDEVNLIMNQIQIFIDTKCQFISSNAVMNADTSENDIDDNNNISITINR